MSVSRKPLPRWSPETSRSKPRDFDPRLGEMICERAANGETLSQICADDDYPLPATFLRWCREDPALAEAYAQAQEDQCEIMLEELVVCADDPSYIMAKNAMDARRLILEKKLPKRYGPRSYMNVTTPTEETPGGVDAGEVRRKIEQMALRARENAVTN